MSAPPLPSGEVAGWDRTWRQLAAFTACVLILRLLVSAGIPLTEDEAYYRLWAQAPALGYFDHPPMIAWWIWLGRSLIGDTALGVRLLPSLGCAVTTFLIFDLACVLGADRVTARRAAIWYNATLLVAAGGFLAVPDAPATLFWIASLWCIARAETGRGAPWWVGAGVAAGLAALSKYSALFLGPGVFLWLVVRPAGRESLSRPWPWVALAIGLAIFGLNVGWNAQHDWRTFTKQFGRIAPHQFAPSNLADLLITQFLLINPLIALWLFRAVGLTRRMRWDGGALLWLSSLPFAAYLLVHALHDRVQAHWPAPLYASFAMIAAIAAADIPSWSLRGRLRAATPVLALVVCVMAVMTFILPEVGVPLPLDPGRQVRDWPDFSTRLEQARRAAGAAWIGTTSYGLAAELLDQTDIRAPVLQVRERDRWIGLADSGADMARPGLVVDLTRRLRPTDLKACFLKVRDLGVIRRAAPGEAGLTYRMVGVVGPRRDVRAAGC
jgi:4-amino-4-deoxy-L-arabinose transferase-like glycosyltransferase